MTWKYTQNQSHHRTTDQHRKNIELPSKLSLHLQSVHAVAETCWFQGSFLDFVDHLTRNSTLFCLVRLTLFINSWKSETNEASTRTPRKILTNFLFVKKRLCWICDSFLRNIVQKHSCYILFVTSTEYFTLKVFWYLGIWNTLKFLDARTNHRPTLWLHAHAERVAHPSPRTQEQQCITCAVCAREHAAQQINSLYLHWW